MLDSGLIEFVTGRDFNGATLSSGKILLNLDSLTEDNFAGVLKHEAFHSAVREWLVPDAYQGLMDRLATLRESADPATSRWFDKASKAIPSDTKPQHLNEELAGYAIEQAKDAPGLIAKWVREFLSALRVAIIKHIPSAKLRGRRLCVLAS